MRFIFSFILLVTFTLRPVMEMAPFFYYQLNIDYIIENYCVNKERPSLQCNGKCYLMSQMKEQNSSGVLSYNLRISEAFIPLYFQENSIDIKLNTTFSNRNEILISYTSSYQFLYINSIEHPPELV